MSTFDEVIVKLQEAEYSDKQQLLNYLLRIVKGSPAKLDAADKQAIREYAYGEVDVLLRDIPREESYQRKDLMFSCMDFLMGVIMTLCPNPSEVPEETRVKIEFLAKLAEQERYIENALDASFEKKPVEEPDVKHLLFLVAQSEDEYQRGQLFAGLIHYRKDLPGLSQGVKAMFAQHISGELKRWMDMEQMSEECINGLEVAVDVSKYFADEKLAGQLYEVLKLGHNNVNYYAVDTLLSLGKTVPEDTVLALAKDLGYADLTHHSFVQHGKEALFPKEYATEEYLAKSDMVHWLMYPTELGKRPDEIEYIGKITYLFKKDIYHVFKYRSDSDTLDDGLKEQWLIGWSNQDGGTFSNFDRYADYDKGDAKATLKNIKKKLIG